MPKSSTSSCVGACIRFCIRISRVDYRGMLSELSGKLGALPVRMSRFIGQRQNDSWIQGIVGDPVSLFWSFILLSLVHGDYNDYNTEVQGRGLTISQVEREAALSRVLHMKTEESRSFEMDTLVVCPDLVEAYLQWKKPKLDALSGE